MGCCAVIRTQGWKVRSLEESALLDSFTSCPVCGISFTPNDTQRQLAAHVKSCLSLQPLLKSLSPQVSPGATLHNRRESLKPLSYTEKSQHFRLHCSRERIPWYTASRTFTFARESLIADSLRLVGSLPAEEFRKEFEVVFLGESGLDVGGLMKEWLYALTSELFKPETELFELADTEQVRYRLSPKNCQLRLLSLTGKVLGKALFDGVPLNCPLCAPLYRQVSGSRAKLQDLQLADKHLFESLSYLKTHNISEVTVSNFTVQRADGEVVELKPGGKDVNITEENKKEYVKLRKEWEVRGSVAEQLESFLTGFRQVVPEEWIDYFDPAELELLMCGQPTIDVEDWEHYTEYRGDFHARHPVIVWFWSIMKSLSQAQLSQFLLFSIGSARLPVEGFSALTNIRGDYVRFTLQSVDFDPRAPYPRAHTCFHRVDLPLYYNQEDLRNALLAAISNSLGFGLE